MFGWFLCVGDTVVLECGGFEHMFLVDSYRFMFVLIGWSTGEATPKQQQVGKTASMLSLFLS